MSDSLAMPGGKRVDRRRVWADPPLRSLERALLPLIMALRSIPVRSVVCASVLLGALLRCSSRCGRFAPVLKAPRSPRGVHLEASQLRF